MTAIDGAGAHSRRWWALAIVLAAQFVYGVDAFIVNVALPTIATDLKASPAQLEAVIAVYFLGYATLVVTGGRLGDIYGTRNVFLVGVTGFTLASLWCGLATTGSGLIVARLLQGATAALMVPQVLATIHVMFPDPEGRTRAFGIYGMALGLAAAAGFVLGGVFIALNVGGLGWRTVFFVNVPIGVAIVAAALRFMPSPPPRGNAQLDLAGASVLFVAMAGLIGPPMLGKEFGWSWPVMAFTVVGLIAFAVFVAVEKTVAAGGGQPLVAAALMRDKGYVRGLCATFCFFFANLSFYLVATLFLQNSLHVSALNTGLMFLPAAIAFIVAAQIGGRRARVRGSAVLIEGCAVQLVALAGLAGVVGMSTHELWSTIIMLTTFGFGQGLVMAPLSGIVMSGVHPSMAGAASGVYATVTQGANAVGVAVVGAVYFAVSHQSGTALSVAMAVIALALAACCVMLVWMKSSR
jgi:EmrB/QacA subfamily drug resistance transporter